MTEQTTSEVEIIEPGDVTATEGSNVPEVMNREQAKRITGEIRQSLAVAHGLIRIAWEQRAWVALGYGSWDEYVRSEFAELSLRPPLETRSETVASLRESGMSTRAIGTATDMSESTVRRIIREAAALVEESEAAREQTATGTDGKQYTATSAEARAKRDERIASLHESGKSLREIAEETGTSKSTVQNALKPKPAPSLNPDPAEDEDPLDLTADDLGLGHYETPRPKAGVAEVEIPGTAATSSTDPLGFSVVKDATTKTWQVLKESGDSVQASPEQAAESFDEDTVQSVADLAMVCVAFLQLVKPNQDNTLNADELAEDLERTASSLDELIAQLRGEA